MMQIKFVFVGALKETYWKNAVQEYQKRLQRYAAVSIEEIPDSKDPDQLGLVEKLLEQEGEKILGFVKPTDYLIALCIEGRQYSSESFAAKLAAMGMEGKRVVFAVGSSNGLGENVKRRANEHFSFSPMTFPHQMARLMLLEQTYRAFKINANERYHK